MMGSSSAAAREDAAAFVLGGVDMRMLAARTATGALARAAGGEVGEKAARFEECIRSLEAEKAKMEVFRRELPISVHLIADVIEWLKDEVEKQRLRRREMLAPPATAKRKAAAAEGVKAEAEADANDKRSWMSSAQLWSCGSHTSTSNSNGGSVKKQQQQHKVSNAFMPLATSPAFAKSPEKAVGAATAMPLPAAVPDLSLSSPAVTTDAPACPAAPSATSSAVTDVAGAQRQQQQQQAVQRKARRCWSPELHRRFVAALQRLGGPQAATPKQIRELMKVDGLTNDEVKSHLQKYRLHTRRASDGGGGGGGDHQMAGGGLWPPPPEQYTTSQHSTSQSGSPQGPLQLTMSSSHAVSVTAGDSCDGGEEEEEVEEEEEDGKSESYSWEMQNGARASSSP
uniref:HTH myb-type domain-containing protein n=1 Tax=Oryza punctata TaxID=4537 RepID=A0A0E0MP44_ORYPU